MSNEQEASFIHCLSTQIKQMEELISTLLEEKDCLLLRNFSALETISQKKESLSAAIDALNKERLRQLGSDNAPKDAALALSNYLQTCSSAEKTKIEQLNETLSQLLIRSRELNTINGQVISSNMQVRQGLLDSLLGKQDSQQTQNQYSASGNLENHGASSRHE